MKALNNRGKAGLSTMLVCLLTWVCTCFICFAPPWFGRPHLDAWLWQLATETLVVSPILLVIGLFLLLSIRKGLLICLLAIAIGCTTVMAILVWSDEDRVDRFVEQVLPADGFNVVYYRKVGDRGYEYPGEICYERNILPALAWSWPIKVLPPSAYAHLLSVSDNHVNIDVMLQRNARPVREVIKVPPH
jgi:hypothetical protein